MWLRLREHNEYIEPALSDWTAPLRTNRIRSRRQPWTVCPADRDPVSIKRLNQPLAGPSDPMDLDYDGKITVLDSRILVTFCTKQYCAQ